MEKEEKDQLEQPETIEKTGMFGDDHFRRRFQEKDDDDDGQVPPPTMGATSFAQVIEAERAQEAASLVNKRAAQFPRLVEGVLNDPSIEDKEGSIANLGPEFSTLVVEGMANTKGRWQPLTDAIVKALQPLFGKKEEPPPASPPQLETKSKNSFMVYKEADGGYRWLAIYSNKFRDRDTPPEIISEASHLQFVKSVNSGELPYPELWLWHIKDTKWGQADFVGYDDNGFAVATGKVDTGKEWVAKSLMEFDGELLTSHGMPQSSVERDPQEKTIITRHVTKEISPLPANVAANEHTGFILSEVEMALPEQDKAKLSALGVDPDRLEAETESKAKETVGLEFKEANTPEVATETGDYVSREEVADLVKSVATSTNQLVQVVGDLAKRIESLETNKLTVDKEVLENTPAASLADLYKSVIGSPEAKIDGRSSLAKSGPEETETIPEAPTGSRTGGGLANVIARRNQQIERGVQ